MTPCPRAIKAMGFPAELSGIQGRYNRCREQWKEHLERSRSVVLRGAERAEQRRKAVILGAGLLHDVPLAELAAMFREVILVDVMHPLASRWSTGHLRNVNRIVADITGTLNEAYRVAWDADKPLPKSEPALFSTTPRSTSPHRSICFRSFRACRRRTFSGRAPIHKR